MGARHKAEYQNEQHHSHKALPWGSAKASLVTSYGRPEENSPDVSSVAKLLSGPQGIAFPQVSDKGQAGEAKLSTTGFRHEHGHAAEFAGRGPR